MIVPSEIIEMPPRQQDVSNLIRKIQTLELNGNAPIDALNYALDQQGWVHNYDVDLETGRLTRLFIASKDCLEYARKNPDILIMGSTYRTNRFEMPLLNIIGVNNNYRNFYVAMIFLRYQTEEDRKTSFHQPTPRFKLA